MNRRDTLVALLTLGIAPFAADAQPAKQLRIATLSFGDPESSGYLWKAFKGKLRELGHTEGKSIIFYERWALGEAKRLPDLAKELVALKPDVMVAVSSSVAEALRQATTEIPIVIANVSDPVGKGFVKSLAHPGGNITGLSTLAADYSPKLLELLLTVLPKLSRVGILFGSDAAGEQLKKLKTAGQSVGANVLMLEVPVQSPASIEDQFALMTHEGIKAVIVVAHPIFFSRRRKIAELAIKSRIASIFMSRDFVEDGGFISYGPNYTASARDAARFVDRILKGAKPADLPVEQASTFELVINRKTARALGLTITPELLLRADEVIE